MSFFSICVLAVGLAMDATAVAAARGLSANRFQACDVVLVAALFGGFQAVMPLLGWVVGSRVGRLVESWDHWIAFVLLASIGGKMIVEAVRGQSEDARLDDDPFDVKVLLVLALATSIDALAAGFTLPMLDAPLGLSVVTIGTTTAVLSAAGLFAGRRFGAILGRRLDIAGGLVLIGLGFKILAQHLYL